MSVCKYNVLPYKDFYIVISYNRIPVIGDYTHLEFVNSPTDNIVYKITDMTLDEGVLVIATIGKQIGDLLFIEFPLNFTRRTDLVIDGVDLNREQNKITPIKFYYADNK